MAYVDLYLDAEWNRDQKIFLLGAATTVNEFRSFYGSMLTTEKIRKLLGIVSGHIYYYGPDIAMLEKNFGIDIANNHICINLLTAFRRIEPGFTSYKLSELEQYYGLLRTVSRYKQNIFTIYKDWFNPEYRKIILQYNKEDVVNLVRLKRRIFGDNNITRDKIINIMYDTIDYYKY